MEVSEESEKFIELFDYLLDILEGKANSQLLSNVCFSSTQYSTVMSIDFMVSSIPCNIRTYNKEIHWHNKAENAKFIFIISTIELDRIEERILTCYNNSKKNLANFYQIIRSEKRNNNIDKILKEL